MNADERRFLKQKFYICVHLRSSVDNLIFLTQARDT